MSGLIVSGAAAGRTGVTDTHEEGLKAGVAAAQLVELGVDPGRTHTLPCVSCDSCQSICATDLSQLGLCELEHVQ